MFRILFVCIAMALPVSAFAMTTDDISPGKTLSGPNLTLRDLKGKVVVVSYFGVNCPACLLEMPQLEDLYKKYQDQGVQVMGFEMQGSTAAATTAFIKDKRITFQISADGKVRSASAQTIPYIFLFGSDGKLAAEHVLIADLEAKLKELAHEDFTAMAGPGPYVKLAPLMAQVKAGQLGEVLKSLREKKGSKDAAEAREANSMLNAFSAMAKSRFDKAATFKTTDPVRAMYQYQYIAQLFAGDELGDKATKEAEALKASANSASEAEADAAWKQIETLLESVRPVNGDKSLKNPAVAAANVALVQKLAVSCLGINQRFPNSKAAKKANDLMFSMQ